MMIETWPFTDLDGEDWIILNPSLGKKCPGDLVKLHGKDVQLVERMATVKDGRRVDFWKYRTPQNWQHNWCLFRKALRGFFYRCPENIELETRILGKAEDIEHVEHYITESLRWYRDFYPNSHIDIRISHHKRFG